MIILDTNVVSELLRPVPAPQVEAWLAAQDPAGVYLTAIGAAELRCGVAILPEGRRRDGHAAAIDGLLRDDFRDRVLPFDSPAATAFAAIAAGRPGPVGRARLAEDRSRASARQASRTGSSRPRPEGFRPRRQRRTSQRPL